MKPRRFSFPGCLLQSIGLLILIGLALGALAWGLIASLSNQIPANSAPLQVVLQKPGDGESFPVNGAVPVYGQAMGTIPLSRLELWADGELVQSYAASIDGLYALDQAWKWTPQVLGVHTLLARAYDKDGRSANSNIVHLQAVPDPGFVLVKPAGQGDTPEKLAQANGISPESLLGENPELGAQDVIPAGSDVFIPLPPPVYQPPEPGPDQSPGSGPTDPAKPIGAGPIFKFDGPGADSLPAQPALKVGVSSCTAKLVFDDLSQNESGFYVYRLAPQAGGFVLVATLTAHDGALPLSYTDPDLRGDYQYYVGAFNAQGESASNIAGVSIDDPVCGPLAQVYHLDELIPGAAAGLDNFYLYVKAGKGWTRIPSGDYNFMDPSQLINLGLWVAPGPPEVKSLEGEAWGWRGGALEYVGGFKKNTAAPAGSMAEVNPSASLMPSPLLEAQGIYDVSTQKYNWLTEITYNSMSGMKNATFHWKTPGKMPQGRWQVSLVSFPDSPSLNPAGLVFDGVAPAPNGADEFFKFPIDLSPLLVTKASAGDTSNQTYSMNPFSPFAPLTGQVGNPETQNLAEIPFLFVPSSASNPNSAFIANPDAAALIAFGLKGYYVRILPMNGNQLAGKPSNTVVVHYEPAPEFKLPPAEFVQLAYDVKIVDYSPMNFPNPTYEFCDVIVSIDKSKLDPITQTGWYTAKPGDPVCAKHKEPESQNGFGAMLSDIGGLIEDGVNFVSDLYAKIDSFIKDAVDFLNPLCQGAKLATQAANSGEKTINDFCKKIAAIAVDAAKAYFGIPPSLPNYDELTGMGKDYLVELAADQLTDCEEECKKLLRDGLDFTLDQLKNNQPAHACSAAVEQNNMVKNCPPEGVVVKPDPRGQYAPAVLAVQLTRPNDPEPALLPGQELKACSLYVDNTYSNDFWIGKTVSLSTPYGVPSIQWQGTSLGGRLFSGAVMSVPVIDPGASITLPVQLDYRRGVDYMPGNLTPIYYSSFDEGNPWLPGHMEAWKQSPYVPDMYLWLNDWYVRYHGATVTFKAACANKSDQRMEGPLVMPTMEQWYGAP